jgi:hypothetical protein
MKTILSKLTIRAAFAIVLLLVGFAAGFPVGRSTGFTIGSEWSFIQADLLAREAGLFMPINYKEGTFHVVVKQPRHLHKDARELANRHEAEMASMSSGKSALVERVQLTQKISLMQ